MMGRAHRRRPKVDEGCSTASRRTWHGAQDAKTICDPIQARFISPSRRTAPRRTTGRCRHGPKLLLVGPTLFGRGSTQLVGALILSSRWLTLLSPFKLPLDNLLRFTTGPHRDHNCYGYHDEIDSQIESQTAYDAFAVGIRRAGRAASKLVVVAKVRAVRDTMRQSLPEAETNQTVDVHMALRRFQLGLQSAEDRQIAMEYLETPGAGTQLWRDKLIASHLSAQQMRDTLAALEAKEPKSHALGYHFTDLDSARLILGSIGIRAANVGQLGGGVSISLASPVDMGWGSDDFAKTVGLALWGSSGTR